MEIRRAGFFLGGGGERGGGGGRDYRSFLSG